MAAGISLLIQLSVILMVILTFSDFHKWHHNFTYQFSNYKDCEFIKKNHAQYHSRLLNYRDSLKWLQIHLEDSKNLTDLKTTSLLKKEFANITQEIKALSVNATLCDSSTLFYTQRHQANTQLPNWTNKPQKMEFK